MSKIAIVTPDIMGPIQNGGVGSAFYFLSFLLAEKNEVSILFYPEQKIEYETLGPWVEFYKKRNISLEIITEDNFGIVSTPWSSRSYRVYLILKERNYDVIHFPDFLGLGYHTAHAKWQGSDFFQSIIVTHLHGTKQWHIKESKISNSDPFLEELFFLEQKTLEYSDVLVSPSEYMKKYVEEHGIVRKKILVIPHAPVPKFKNEISKKNGYNQPNKIDIAFVGRFEKRKGLSEFLAAIGYIKSPLRVAFFGKNGELVGETGLEAIERFKKTTIHSIEIFESLNQIQIMNTLQVEEPLVVIPSLADNSPCVIHESLSLGVNLLVTDVGGVGELIDQKFHNEMLIDLGPESFAQKILSRLKNPKKILPAAKTLNSQNIWDGFHKNITELLEKDNIENANLKILMNKDLKISICIATKSRPHFLSNCLSSIANQRYKNFDVLIGDDDSEEVLKKENAEIVQTYRRTLEIQFYEFNFNNPSLVRNELVKKSNADFIVFVDDDNVAEPFMIESFLRIRNQTKADIITTALLYFYSSELNFQNQKNQFWTPTGYIKEFAFILNTLGDTTMMIDRNLFNVIKGFRSEVKYGEDWDLIHRAIVSNAKFDFSSKALIQYRIHPENRSLKMYNQEDHVFGPLLENMPEEVQSGFKVCRRILSQTKKLNTENLKIKNFDFCTLTDFINLEMPASTDNCSISYQNKKMVVVTSGIDAKTNWNLGFKTKAAVLFRAKIHCSCNTYIQIYFLIHQTDIYSEKNSVIIPLNKGWNYVERNLAEIYIDEIRFDFGDVQCEYVFPTFQIFSKILSIPNGLNIEYQFSKIDDVDFNNDFQFREISPDEVKLEQLDYLDNKYISRGNDPKIIFENAENADYLYACFVFQLSSSSALDIDIFLSWTVVNDFCENNKIRLNIPSNNKKSLYRALVYCSSPVKFWRIDPGASAGDTGLEKVFFQSGFKTFLGAD